MANPFSIRSFRKNQKFWMAALMVMCMASFVILPTVADLMVTNEVANPLVATTSFGEFRETDVALLMNQRELANQFMGNVLHLAYGRYLPEIFGPITSEEGLIDNQIMVRKAQELGMVVSDRAINDFLRSQTSNRLSKDQFNGLVQAMKTSTPQVFNALRNELLANRLQEVMLFGTLESVPPLQRWDYYRRLNARAEIEFVPLAVAGFLDQVPDPDEATVTQFFNEYREDYPKPGSPDPGFHQPQRARFQYFRADYDSFFKPDAIALEDIEAHYEKHKAQRYRYRGGSARGAPEGAAPEDSGQSQPEQPASEAPPAEQPPAEEPAGDAPASDQPGAAATPDEASSDAPEGEGQPGDQPGNGPDGDTPAPPEDGAQALRRPQRDAAGQELVIRGQGPDVATPGEDQPAAADAETGSEGADASGGESAPQEDGSPAEQPATEQPTADAETQEPSASEGPGPVLTPEFEPLANVSNEIRQELASEVAGKQIQDALRRVQSKVTGYLRDLKLWKANQKPDAARRGAAPTIPEPTPPDFAALAAENGVTFHETQLLSALEINLTTDIGQSMIDMTENFPVVAYERLELDSSKLSMDRFQNQYLFWKVEETLDRVPELSDPGIRDEVVRAWKLGQARELARARGDELAAEANELGVSLAEFVKTKSGLEAHAAGPFSWMTVEEQIAFMTPIPPSISAVEGVDQPGDKFMSQVFSLPVGQTGVTVNQPETVVFLVRPTKFEPSEAVLRTMFLADNFARYRAVGIDDRNEIAREWIEQLEQEVGLRWERTPRGNRRR